MQYEIGGGAFPVVTCNLSDGESMITESGAMVWMTPNMEMSTSGGGIGKMFSKAFSGEALFQNIWTAHGDGMICVWLLLPRPHRANRDRSWQELDFAEALVPCRGKWC